MNGWLVLASCRIDDIPLRLCATEAEASRLAMDAKEHEIIDFAAIKFKRRGVCPLHVEVVEFNEGRMERRRRVKSFEGE